MPKILCIGCKRLFEDPRGYSNHKRRCNHNIDAERARRLQQLESTQHDLNQIQFDGGGEEIYEGQQGVVNTAEGVDDDTNMDVPDEVPRTPTPELRPSGRPNRKIRLPNRYRDELPPLPASVPDQEHQHDPDHPSIDADPVSGGSEDLLGPVASICVPLAHHTFPNSYGIYRIYPAGEPSCSPDEHYSLDSVFNTETLATDSARVSHPRWALLRSRSIQEKYYEPFSSPAAFRLMTWFHNGSTSKSLSDLDDLIENVILAPDFEKDDLVNFRASREVERLDKLESYGTQSRFSTEDGWVETSVEIALPAEGVTNFSEDLAPKFQVPGLFYRPLLNVTKAALQETMAEKFHLFPYREFWQPSPGSAPQRLYSELYTSDIFLAEHVKIQSQYQGIASDSQIENVILALNLWSDSTHLARFGNASLWPIYLFIGNLSKYTRGKPTSLAAHHLAYIPKLVDTVQDFYRKTFNKPATSAVLTHCKRELMHAIWLQLLDDDFVDAYANGILIECADGTVRRFFPRLFTYSADYPEKTLLACIKTLGSFPCPRCVISKDGIAALGTKSDMRKRDSDRTLRVDNHALKHDIEVARKWIYVDGKPLTSKRLEDLLGTKSLVPTRNAFSVKLGPHGLDFYTIFVPDLLHEFELGVWKAVFTHLIRILYAAGGDGIQTLNERYRQVPTFGRDTIRKFSNNASGMKNLAGRDFEDLLQCAIPVFEGLLPREHDKVVADLLFELGTWHMLAKLRVHTESTIGSLEASTSRLGHILRHFRATTCSAYDTHELPSEEAARGRRTAALAAKRGDVSERAKGLAQKGRSGRRRRTFNMSTYKIHALGDYPRAIRMFGTTDGFTTQVGELEHRRVKRFYQRVHKGKFTRGIAKQQQRERVIAKMKELAPQASRKGTQKRRDDAQGWGDSISSPDDETLRDIRPQQHHHISADVRYKVQLSTWLDDKQDDPALKNFIPRLKEHLLGRMLGRQYDGDEHPFTAQERNALIIINNRIYKHNTLRVNYTTYDLQRAQDSLNPRTHADFMTLSHEDQDDMDPGNIFPYWFGRIIGIYHAAVMYTGPESHSEVPQPQRMEFLFVRWFGRDLKHRAGWRHRRLNRIGFVEGDDDAPFGFLDPQEVIRGVHLIPAFHYGRTREMLAPSRIARPDSDQDEDWKYFYVNHFVDRDLGMRFFGGGVGHKCTREATNHFLRDCDRLEHDTNQTDEGNNDVGTEDQIEESDTTGEAVQDDDDDYGYGDPLNEDSDEDLDGFEGGEPEGGVACDEMGDALDTIDDLGFGDL